MKTVRLAILISLFLIVSFIVPAPRPTQAQAALSPICIFVNSGGANSTVGPGNGIATGPFNAGEVITITATLGTATTAQFRIENPIGTIVTGPASVPGTLTYTVPIAAATLVAVQNEPSSNGSINVTWTCTGISAAGGGSEVKFFDPGDDRLNREPGQPAALYCRNQGDVHIYAVNPDDSKGKIGLVVTKAEIDAVINANPSANTLIKQSADGKFKLFYLPTTKELSFITNEARSGKPYTFVWKGSCR